MKLEFEVTSQNNFTKNQFSSDHNSADTREMLRSGIKCAKDGSRVEARLLLLRVTEIEPENETAWMWLASISEYPEELLVFLQKVLTFNPENERAVEWTKATKSLLAKTFVERGIHASQENQIEFAVQCFTQALLHDNENELAWLWLATNSDSPEEKSAHLHQVLQINPENETALASLQSTKHEMSQAHLKKANFAAMSGERETARQLLAEVLQEAPELEEAWILKAYLEDDSAEKIACYEKILSLNPENEAAQAGLVSLKMLIQKSSEAKFNAETIQEILENNQIGNFSAPEDSGELKSEESSAKNDFHSASFENATDELDSDFPNDIKSQGGFADVRPLETQENEDYVVFNEMEMPESKEEFQLFEAAGFGQDHRSDESEDVFEIEVSDAEDLSNIFNSEKSAEDFDSQDGNSLFESSNEMILLPSESFDSLPAVEDFSQKIDSFESAENSVAAQDSASESALIETHGHQETQEFQAESQPEQTVEEQQKNFFTDNEYQAADNAEGQIHRTVSPNEPQACPFCFEMNEPQALVCNSCRTMISLSDLEMLLSHREASADVLEMTIEDLETGKASRSLNETELINLGIAYFNNRNLRKGLACLQEASQLDLNNVVLSSQVNSLTIRLSEIEEQESRAEGAMPKNLTIMVVDDSPTVRKLISGKLEKCGHTVVAAAGGQEALSQIKDVVPDLILLDIMMPEMDGYQICKLIRSNEPTKNVPVIMISGKDGFFDKVRGRMAGTSGYITKPFGPETLMRTIETYVV